MALKVYLGLKPRLVVEEVCLQAEGTGYRATECSLPSDPEIRVSLSRNPTESMAHGGEVPSNL